VDDADKADIAEFAKNLGVDYPILLGKESVGEAYGGVQFLPATIYVGRDGKVVDKVFGLKGRDIFADFFLVFGWRDVAYSSALLTH
jgi:hypothetical protein